MMKMNRAVMWMLTSGEGDDYRVHGIYTDKAEAEAAADLANRGRIDFEDEYRVEEVAVLYGIMPRRAEIIHITGYPQEEGDKNVESPRDTRVAFEEEPILYVDYYDRTGNLRVTGEPEAARKAYAERAARIEADAEGITR